MSKKFIPNADKVLVRRVDEKDHITSGGIIVPSIVSEKPQDGFIVAVGYENHTTHLWAQNSTKSCKHILR